MNGLAPRCRLIFSLFCIRPMGWSADPIEGTWAGLKTMEISLVYIWKILLQYWNRWHITLTFSKFQIMLPAFHHTSWILYTCIFHFHFSFDLLCSVRKEQQQIAKAEFYNILLSLSPKSDYNIQDAMCSSICLAKSVLPCIADLPRVEFCHV